LLMRLGAYSKYEKTNYELYLKSLKQ